MPPKITADQTLTSTMTAGVIGSVTATLAGIDSEDLAPGTLRPEHLDHGSIGVRYFSQSNPGVSLTYPQTGPSSFTVLNHGSATSTFSPGFSFVDEWAVVRSRLTVEIVEGRIDPLTGVDLVTFRPRIVANALGGGTLYPWNQGPGNTDGLRFGVSRHNPGQAPQSGPTDAGLITYAQDREIAHRTMTFSFMFPVQNSSPGSTATINDVYWDLSVEALDVTFGRFNLDLSIDLI